MSKDQIVYWRFLLHSFVYAKNNKKILFKTLCGNYQRNSSFFTFQSHETRFIKSVSLCSKTAKPNMHIEAGGNISVTHCNISMLKENELSSRKKTLPIRMYVLNIYT